MENKTLADRRKEAFFSHAQAARDLAAFAIAEIDEAIGDSWLPVSQPGRSGQPPESMRYPANFHLGSVSVDLPQLGLNARH